MRGVALPVTSVIHHIGSFRCVRLCVRALSEELSLKLPASKTKLKTLLEFRPRTPNAPTGLFFLEAPAMPDGLLRDVAELFRWPRIGHSLSRT